MSVSSISIPPKIITEKYRGETIEIKFDPVIKAWNWSFTIITQPVVITGTGHVSPNEALRSAKRSVDKVHGV